MRNHAASAYASIAEATRTFEETIVILNPNNGHDALKKPNADWIAGIDALKRSKVRIVGYVHTNYGKRQLEEIRKEIEGYAENRWGVEGIFVDEHVVDVRSDEAAWLVHVDRLIVQSPVV